MSVWSDDDESLLCEGSDNGGTPRRPDPYSLPPSFLHSYGRIKNLYLKLQSCYQIAGKLLEMRAHPALDMERQQRVNADFSAMLAKARKLIYEIVQIGADLFVPDALVPHLHFVIPKSQVTSNYLCQTPHYLHEDYSDHPIAHENIRFDVDDIPIAHVNNLLQTHFSSIAWSMNRIRFFRDQKIMMFSTSDALSATLSGEILSCRNHFDEAVRIINARHTDREDVIGMPDVLRDAVLSDVAVMNLYDFEGARDISCLFPGGHTGLDRNSLYLLHESPSGFSIFIVSDMEAVQQGLSAICPVVEEFDRFKLVVKLVVFYPFVSREDALKQCKAMFQGVLSTELRCFLQLYAPVPQEWNKYTIGVSDSVFAHLIFDTLGIPCKCDELIHELLRGVRLHFHRFVELDDSDEATNQLCLGHMYCAAKLGPPSDQMCIHACNQMDFLENTIESISLIIREWYDLFYPDISPIIKDNLLSAKIALFILKRPCLDLDDLPNLIELVGDLQIAISVLKAVKSSVYAMPSAESNIILKSAERVVSMVDSRSRINEYMVSIMRDIAPNLSVLMGEHDGARLISYAGGLSMLSKCSTSDIELLGTGSGILMKSSLMEHVSEKNKAHMIRYLASKCLIASWFDYNSEDRSSELGLMLHKKAKEIMDWYEKNEYEDMEGYGEMGPANVLEDYGKEDLMRWSLRGGWRLSGRWRFLRIFGR